MKRFLAVVRAALFAYRIDPLCYVLSVATIVSCAVRFFLAFFAPQGSCDLRPLFATVPAVSVLTVPLLVFRLRSFIADDSLPVAPFAKLAAVTTASFCAYLLPLLLLLAVPACVRSFGDMEAGQLCAGYAGVLLYGFAACALSVALFSLCARSGAANSVGVAVPLLVSVLVLLLANSVHKLPQYVQAGAALSFCARAVSFSWHFDAASKGVFDSRDIFFYMIAAFALLLVSAAAEYRRTGRKISRLTALLAVLLCATLAVASQRVYFRIDATESRAFTLSPLSKSLLSRLHAPLRITYYRSAELKNLYPQTGDVAEFLALYADESRQVSVQVESVSERNIGTLQSLGVQARQLRNASQARTEFVTVYSAVVLQYLEKELILPFVLSADTLEYDVTRRLEELVEDEVRTVYLVAGNDRQSDYGYLESYLEMRGFAPLWISAARAETALSSLAPDAASVLAVFGSASLSPEACAEIERLVMGGTGAFIATSPYTVAIEDDWTVQKTAQDALLPLLAAWGFGFERALCQDIACFPLSLQSGEGSAAEVQRVNYPMWLSLLPQTAAPSGATLFWASPLVLYGEAQPLLVTSAAAWTQEEAENGAPFAVNPFLLAKSAREAGSVPRSLVVAATVDGSVRGYYGAEPSSARVTVVADQYALSSLMTAYISAETMSDFRNFDFFAGELLRLRGDEALAALLQKKSAARPLYKLSDALDFAAAQKRTLFLALIVLPLAVVLLGVVSHFQRKRRRR